MSANNYTAESSKCVTCMRFLAVGFSPLPEIGGISIVMYVSELFVAGKCIIDSLVRHTRWGQAAGYQPRPQAGG